MKSDRLEKNPEWIFSINNIENLLAGCLLAIGGNLLISVSLNLQKYAHMRNELRVDAIHYTKDPLWWVGVALMGFGEIGNFSAYGFAPASLVAPLGTTTVIANLFLAALILKEKIRAENLFGSAMAVIGAFLIVTFSSKTERVRNGEELNTAVTQVSFIVYICLELLALVVLFMVLYWMEIRKVVVYLLIASIIASFTVICAKGLSGMIQLSFAGYSQFDHPILYAMTIIMIVTAIIQVKFLNEAMKSFESTVVVPTNFVFFTISAIMAGIVFYKEFWGLNGLEICMFLVGCLMSFVGVYFITMNRSPESESESAGVLSETASVDSKPQVTANIFPAWLLATVNVGEVQPKGDIQHLSDNDRAPFLSPLPEESSTSLDTLSSHDDSPVRSKPATSYGATG
ncbi:NIPA-like protein 2 [Ylistrum balloti]|uniref:NIPA-like protein 2 n=1 Tax=Ylistrum balloti TaxID=509963 RepID=UPI00290586D1|nr:NIPA-like protein 2 [Ylistrum balloti]